jgi:hypothetical protein
MLVVLDGEGLETPLPDVPAMMVVAEVAPDVGGQEPMHPPPEVAVIVWPEHQMEVITQQAIGREPHGQSDLGLADGLEEGEVVALLVEHVGASVAAIDDVVTGVPGRGSRGAWHNGDPPRGKRLPRSPNAAEPQPKSCTLSRPCVRFTKPLWRKHRLAVAHALLNKMRARRRELTESESIGRQAIAMSPSVSAGTSSATPSGRGWCRGPRIGVGGVCGGERCAWRRRSTAARCCRPGRWTDRRTGSIA